MNAETEQGYSFVKLVKRTSPTLVPAPVFFENAPGGLRSGEAGDARKLGFEAASRTIAALSQDNNAII